MQNHPFNNPITRKPVRQRVQKQRVAIVNAVAPKAQLSRQAVR